MSNKNNTFKFLFPYVSFLIVGILIGGSLMQSYNMVKMKKSSNNAILGSNSENSIINEASAYLKFKAIKEAFVPFGIPAVYGKELDISFDEVQDAINKVKGYGPTFGAEDQKIALDLLTPTQLKRYKKIGDSIACEFCCGVKTMTNEDGTAACGCAHSIMMRGLTAYLLQNHPEMTDDEILNELQMWKRTYFPKQTLTQELDRLSKSGEPGIDQILQEFPDFLPQMVGGC